MCNVLQNFEELFMSLLPALELLLTDSLYSSPLFPDRSSLSSLINYRKGPLTLGLLRTSYLSFESKLFPLKRLKIPFTFEFSHLSSKFDMMLRYFISIRTKEFVKTAFYRGMGFLSSSVRLVRCVLNS